MVESPGVPSYIQLLFGTYPSLFLSIPVYSRSSSFTQITFLAKDGARPPVQTQLVVKATVRYRTGFLQPLQIMRGRATLASIDPLNAD